MPDIVGDNATLEKAVKAAKWGDFNTALPILRSKPYLINCIPERRSWGVLHQAVYWNKPDIVKEILNILPCDADIKTKKARNNDAPASSTPMQVTKAMGGREGIKQILEDHIKHERASRFGGNMTYIVSASDGEIVIDHLPLFMKALVQYKKTLLGKKTPKDHLLELLKQVMKEEKYRWNAVEEQLHLALYGIDRAAADKIRQQHTELDFFEEIVKFYTGLTYHTTINNAVSRDFSSTTPTAEDMAIALYDLLLDMIIMSWDGLKAKDCPTYRGVPRVHCNVKKGDKIMFTHFVSSSLDEEVATDFAKSKGPKGTLFIIDNSAKSINQPKYIKELSCYKYEEECLFGIGAEFKVTSVKESGQLRKIGLELIKWTCGKYSFALSVY